MQLNSRWLTSITRNTELTVSCTQSRRSTEEKVQPYEIKKMELVELKLCVLEARTSAHAGPADLQPTSAHL